MGQRFDRFRQGNFAQGLKKTMPFIGGLGGAALGALTAGPGGALAGAAKGGTLGGTLGGLGQQALAQGPQGDDVSSGGGNSPFRRAMTGSPESILKMEQFRPNQESAMDQTLQQALQGLQNPYEGFEPIADYARQSFQNKTVPDIMHQFNASGSNAPTSAGPWNQMGEYGAAMEGQLGALRSQYGMENRSQMMQLLGFGLTPRDVMLQQAATNGALDSFLPGVSRIVGQFGADAVMPLLKKLFGLGDDSDVKKDLPSAQTPGIGSPITSRNAGIFNTLEKFKQQNPQGI